MPVTVVLLETCMPHRHSSCKLDLDVGLLIALKTSSQAPSHAQVPIGSVKIGMAVCVNYTYGYACLCAQNLTCCVANAGARQGYAAKA